MSTFTLPIPLLTRRLRGGGTSVLGSTATVTVAAHPASITNGADITFVTALVDVAANTATIKVDASLGCSLATMEAAANTATVNSETNFGCSLATMDVATNAATVLSVTSIECSVRNVILNAHDATIVVVNPGGHILGRVVLPAEVFIGEDVPIEWQRMQQEDGTPITGATVGVTLRRSTGVTVATLELVATEEGGNWYRGMFDATVTSTLTNGAVYYLDVSAISGMMDGFRRMERLAGYHRCRVLVSPTLHIAEDIPVEWQRMQEDDGTPVVDADVVATLKQANGTAVAVASMPPVVDGSNTYRGVFRETATENLVSGVVYYIEVAASSGENDWFRRIDRKAAYHKDVP